MRRSVLRLAVLMGALFMVMSGPLEGQTISCNVDWPCQDWCVTGPWAAQPPPLSGYDWGWPLEQWKSEGCCDNTGNCWQASYSLEECCWGW